jgi:hypothetical protein
VERVADDEEGHGFVDDGVELVAALDSSQPVIRTDRVSLT